MALTHPRRNNGPAKGLHLKQIAELVDGEIVGNPDLLITGVAGIQDAREGDITFLAYPKYLPFLDRTQATAVITSKEITHSSKPLVRSANPSQAFNRLIHHFAPPKAMPPKGVHASSVVDPSAVLGAEVSIGPCAVIEAGVRVGDRSVIGAGVVLERESIIGADCHLHPNVTIGHGTLIGDRVVIHSGAVVGGDGFGFDTLGGTHARIPHIGIVVIEDEVEIGACVCIDRAKFDKTWIKKGVKIDNLVQIAHNVVVGENSMIISQSGISGSTELGRQVVLAGQVGVTGHIKIGDNVIVGATAGVTKSVPENTIVLGSPAKPIAEQKRIVALISRLPELFKDLLAIKKKLDIK